MMLALTILLVGCETRSISDSGFDRDRKFRGELSELEVLGISASQRISEQDIQRALETKKKIEISRGDRLVLIQSGARFPDSAMVEQMEKFYRVIPLSGVPNRPAQYPFSDTKPIDPVPMDKAFRLAAAKAGAKTIVAYWGVLESSRKGYGSKAISWVPIAGSFIPDEDQEMRIRLKVAVIDVETGSWEMLTPHVYEDERTSARINRESSDQTQVEELKVQGYARAVADLQTRFEK
ncbi:MAG: aminopeptidase [Verrucomicrobiota bacterium]